MHICPYCKREFESLQGWKRHATVTHGGYSDADLAQAAGVAEPRGSAQAVLDSMLGPEAKVVEPQESKSAASGPPPAPAPTGKRVKATPRKFKELVSSIPARIFAAHKIELDDEDKASIEEATEFVTDLFGVEFNVPEDKYVVQSRLWGFVWVIGVLVLVYVKHRFAEIFVKEASDDSRLQNTE